MKPAAQLAVMEFIDRYGQCDLDTATHIVAIGGDGTALRALHAALRTSHVPVFAMRLSGSVGALGNPLCLANLRERLEAARRMTIYPLKAEAHSTAGGISCAFGINEVVISRQHLQAANLRVRAGSTERWRKVIGDGVLVASPIGSAGYNQSAGGPILPLDSQLLALTGMAIRNRSERCNTVVSERVQVDVDVIDRAAKLAAIPAGGSPANRRRSSHCCSHIQRRGGRPIRRKPGSKSPGSGRQGCKSRR
jgi:NAD+ kinase